MTIAKRAYIAIVVLALMLAGSAFIWIFYGQLPKKAPFRARQVMSVQISGPESQVTDAETASINSADCGQTIGETTNIEEAEIWGL